MTNQRFDEILKNRIGAMETVLANKAAEYSGDGDRLHNFKIAARMDGTTPEQAWKGMFLKHLVSIWDMIGQPGMENPHLIDEKIGDAINYLVLLEAMLIERFEDDLYITETINEEGLKSRLRGILGDPTKHDEFLEEFCDLKRNEQETNELLQALSGEPL